MNRREQYMTLGVAGILVLLINLFLWNWLFGALSSARHELADRKSTRSEQAVYMRERELWEQRKQWIEQKQPVFKEAAETSSLLEQVKQVAAKYNVLIENPSIGQGEVAPTHQTVFASIETRSDWPSLVHFLYDVQQPDGFVVFESVNIAVDGNDATQMRGKFKIARWFAPANAKKG